jgi:epoxyqueuosine reductase
LQKAQEKEGDQEVLHEIGKALDMAQNA